VLAPRRPYRQEPASAPEMARAKLQKRPDSINRNPAFSTYS
jgi:hypothetical protein